jgi:hypothetical protein
MAISNVMPRQQASRLKSYNPSSARERCFGAPTTTIEVANVPVFLAADQASAMTGIVVNLSGGSIID